MLNRRDERGTVIVLVTLVVVVLVGSAAFVVDLGRTREVRRQLQNAADAAALGAAQELPNLVAAEAKAKELVLANAPDGSFDWSSSTKCHPGDRNTAVFTVASTTPCIWFNQSYTRIHVQVPDQTEATIFGSVLGTDSLSTKASADARVVPAGMASIQPFGLYAGFDTGVACLKTSSGGKNNVICSGPIDGNFNMLDIYMYGNDAMPTTARCSGQESDRLQNNIALGADHMFSIYSVAAGEKLDNCGVYGPNTLKTKTGNFISAFDAGLLHGTGMDGGKPARMMQVTEDEDGTIWQTAGTIAGKKPDNKPLWEFIGKGSDKFGADSGDIPVSCRRASFTTAIKASQVLANTQLQTCFDDYDNGTGCSGAVCDDVVFGLDTFDEPGPPVTLYDIQLTPRFAYVPVFLEANPPTGTSSNVHIAKFQAVFLQTLYGGCNANSCSVNFEPGPWNTSSANQGAANTNIEALSAFVFAAKMLPGNLASEPNQVGANIYVELTD